MDQCARCGHVLGIGRFCVNCGHPRGEAVAPPDASPEATAGGDDWRTGTAERPAVRDGAATGPTVPPPVLPPAEPPPAYGAPGGPRYPLYADEPTLVPGSDAGSGSSPDAGLDVPTLVPGVGAPSYAAAPVAEPRRNRTLLPWLAVAAVLLVMVGLGAFLLLGGGDDDETAADPGTSESASPTDSGGASSEPTSEPTSPEPTPTGPTEPTEPTPKGPPVSLASGTEAVAPVTAPPGQAVDGSPVRYDATNMLDERNDTAWRAPGDLTGGVITFTFGEPVQVTSVGLINGYTKTDPGYDGYTANRRITAVQWVLDDGTTVDQRLGDSREVQSVPVDDAATTTSLQLRIVSVTRPGGGRQGRDYTAISEVVLFGRAT
ncbi:NADase-type glycan-binding domain-containing protein [Nocardioides litoris]|uniref:NADase-type glycan-binding domain-containing protein n=1 Tax=Nocardioides litoris TaxID=1926648 RepID=UPI00112205E4|nr:hypothetical protein [Nocardioides litoris]